MMMLRMTAETDIGVAEYGFQQNKKYIPAINKQDESQAFRVWEGSLHTTNVTLLWNET